MNRTASVHSSGCISGGGRGVTKQHQQLMQQQQQQAYAMAQQPGSLPLAPHYPSCSFLLAATISSFLQNAHLNRPKLGKMQAWPTQSCPNLGSTLA